MLFHLNLYKNLPHDDVEDVVVGLPITELPFYPKLRYLAKYMYGYIIKGEFMNNKKMLALIAVVEEKQKGISKIVEELKSIIKLEIENESLSDEEIQTKKKEAKEIIKSYIKENGNILNEVNQKNLFSLLLDVNYKKESMSHFLRDLNIKYNYLPALDNETWSRLEIGDVDG